MAIFHFLYWEVTAARFDKKIWNASCEAFQIAGEKFFI